MYDRDVVLLASLSPVMGRGLDACPLARPGRQTCRSYEPGLVQVRPRLVRFGILAVHSLTKLPKSL